jgi:hypothetical protein
MASEMVGLIDADGWCAALLVTQGIRGFSHQHSLQNGLDNGPNIRCVIWKLNPLCL